MRWEDHSELSGWAPPVITNVLRTKYGDPEKRLEAPGFEDGDRSHGPRNAALEAGKARKQILPESLEETLLSEIDFDPAKLISDC